jgi:group I intron endonuclease
MARGIYKIINIVNNKFYVGSAVNLGRRKSKHFSELRKGKHNNRRLQAAWDKYGESSFIFAVVQELKGDEDTLAAENIWLKQHVGKNYCYNIGVDATAPMLGMYGELSPTWGYKHTEETKQKISEAGKGRKQSKETKVKRVKTMQGHQVLRSTRDKISKTLSGEGNFWYGKKRPDHGGKVSKVVIFTDANGIPTRYDSILKLRETLGVTPTTVNRALKSSKPFKKGKFIGCSISYE